MITQPFAWRPFIVKVLKEDCGYFANQTIPFERLEAVLDDVDTN
jgi:hypothetical protein